MKAAVNQARMLELNDLAKRAKFLTDRQRADKAAYNELKSEIVTLLGENRAVGTQDFYIVLEDYNRVEQVLQAARFDRLMIKPKSAL